MGSHCDNVSRETTSSVNSGSQLLSTQSLYAVIGELKQPRWNCSTTSLLRIDYNEGAQVRQSRNEIKEYVYKCVFYKSLLFYKREFENNLSESYLNIEFVVQ